jgi:hypothetical protein
VRAAEKEWRRAPFLDGERGEAGGTADDNGEARFRNFGRNDECSAGARFHDPAARQGAVCKPLFIPINLLLTITAQHCLIKESRLGP